MRTIIYHSTATQAFSVPQLELLVLDAREFNRAHDITGVLLYGGRRFVQCIEGPDAAVEAAMQRICASRRHDNIQPLLDAGVETRSFSGWYMGLAVPDPSGLITLWRSAWDQLAGEQHQPAADDGSLPLLRQLWAELQG